MKTLGFINEDNLFTNLGLLLSDQCMHSVKVAIFSASISPNLKIEESLKGHY